jgi:hypothetical protein
MLMVEGEAMASRTRKAVLWRLVVVVAVGGACIAGAAWYRKSLRRKPVPPDVQADGEARIQALLADIAETQFGKSERGVLLSGAIGRLMRQGKVAFTTDRRAQAVYRREWGGSEVLYVRAMCHSGNYKHLDRDDMAEAIFHEAVHAMEGGKSESIDEECDAFAAGLCAGAAVTGKAVHDILRLSGLPVAEFVVRGYPKLERNPTYVPVGETQDWLKERTGLGWVTYPYFRKKPGRKEE